MTGGCPRSSCLSEFPLGDLKAPHTQPVHIKPTTVLLTLGPPWCSLATHPLLTFLVSPPYCRQAGLSEMQVHLLLKTAKSSSLLKGQRQEHLARPLPSQGQPLLTAPPQPASCCPPIYWLSSSFLYRILLATGPLHVLPQSSAHSISKLVNSIHCFLLRGISQPS